MLKLSFFVEDSDKRNYGAVDECAEILVHAGWGVKIGRSVFSEPSGKFLSARLTARGTRTTIPGDEASNCSTGC
ncbi:MAG: hypothetical protein AUG89_00380 [Acidobacteria bacterium 13_1_20CM_4_56_7]|nr:MAG: hypothetical protein AUG89_00380 [Acidobacteria bacterium 13_1_20CM_4_56_7]PYV50187.1 MAG: hypothetical protein DMG92_08635 [Acidobacteriota bacterium]